MPDTFHAAPPDELDGLALARLVSRIGVEVRGPATFLGDEDGDPGHAWRLWLGAWFAPILAPAIAGVHRLAGEMRPGEVADADRALDRALDDPLRLRSLAAAAPFLEGKSGMRGNREWCRFAELVATGESPGHVATLFALQSALYHLPLAGTLAAYAWFELESGLPRTGFRDRPGSGGEALALFATALPEVRLAMGRGLGESDGDAERLRAI